MTDIIKNHVMAYRKKPAGQRKIVYPTEKPAGPRENVISYREREISWSMWKMLYPTEKPADPCETCYILQSKICWSM